METLGIGLAEYPVLKSSRKAALEKMTMLIMSPGSGELRNDET